MEWIIGFDPVNLDPYNNYYEVRSMFRDSVSTVVTESALASYIGNRN